MTTPANQPRPDPGDHHRRGGCPYDDLCAGCRVAMDSERRMLSIALHVALGFVGACVIAMAVVGAVSA